MKKKKTKPTADEMDILSLTKEQPSDGWSIVCSNEPEPKLHKSELRNKHERHIKNIKAELK